MTPHLPISSTLRSLIVFFALAFGISWMVWIPTALASYELLTFQFDPTLSGLLGAFGPCFAAIITIAIFEGRAGFGALFKRLCTWRVGIQWYLFVLLWTPAFSLAKTGLAVLFGSPAPDFSQPPFIQLYPIPDEIKSTIPFIAFLPMVFIQQLLISSPMGEEPGWRGFALPVMQSRMNNLSASLVLGFLWGIWHLPLWMTRGHPLQGVFPGWEILNAMATATLFTWVYNNTNGSLLLAMLFHTSLNITGLFIASADIHPLVNLALVWGTMVLIVSRFDPAWLSHKTSGD